MSRTARAGAVIAAVAVALTALATPASAHSALVSSDPADGSVMDAAPTTVALTFTEPISDEFDAVTVVGPDGAQYAAAEPTVDGAVVSVGVLPLGPAGTYTIGYRVISADSHPISGSSTFTLSTAATSTVPAPPPSASAGASTSGSSTAGSSTAVVSPTAAAADTDGGTPVWPFLVGAGLLVAAGTVLALRGGRKA